MIKNVDCAACMEAPKLVPTATRNLRGDGNGNGDGNGDGDANTARALGKAKDVFVNALNCDATNPNQIWNLLSLEPSGNWYLFESAQTKECMQLVGDCNPAGSLYDIQMGPCDYGNPKGIWAFTGVGEIVNFECLRSNYESDTLFHSTPDIYLEAECSNKGGKDYLDLSSQSADSEDQAQNFWILYPASFNMLGEN